MYVFEIDCPNKGLGEVMAKLQEEGITTASRNGPVIRFPRPVCLEYTNPRRRLLDHPVRKANHFFHLFETLWMLAGSKLVKPLDLFNSGMKQYSDDGITFAAAYGHRWRKHFGFDQLQVAIEKLKANPEDRRVVIQMWDPVELQKTGGKDFACNQQILLDTRPSPSVGLPPVGQSEKPRYLLDMTVTNRSNDLIYGAMGSNLYHFSFLHEWLALHAGLDVGSYYQISKNMHLYLENEDSKRCWEQREEFLKVPSPIPDLTLTTCGSPRNYNAYEDFVLHDLKLDGTGSGARGSWLEKVALPLCEAYRIYKFKAHRGITLPLESRVKFAIDIIETCESVPLRTACRDWMKRQLKD